MNENQFTESVVDQAALAWLESLDYTILSGPDMCAAEQDNYGRGKREEERGRKREGRFTKSHAALELMD